MLTPILQGVHERVSNLAWTLQSSAMPAIAPELAATTQQPIHATRDANDEAADRGTELVLTLRLHEQVQMIFLNRIMNDAKTGTLAVFDAAEYGPRDVLSA